MVVISTLSFFAFALGHAWLRLGAGHALAFWILSFVVSLTFELLGTSQGWIYGSYQYTDRLGVKVFGLVPILVPLAWFMMMYASYAVANALAPWAQGITGWLWLTLLSALAMTAWDLVNDPIMVTSGHWTWQEKGPYFGIPLSNYVGWLETTVVVFGLYRLLEWVHPPRGDETPPWFATLPVLAYGVTALTGMASLVRMGQEAVALVGLFSMGLCVLVALGNMLLSRQEA